MPIAPSSERMCINQRFRKDRQDIEQGCTLGTGLKKPERLGETGRVTSDRGDPGIQKS